MLPVLIVICEENTPVIWGFSSQGSVIWQQQRYFITWLDCELTKAPHIAPWRTSYAAYDMNALKIKAHVDVIKWKHFPRNWLFVRGIHRSPVNSPHKYQWRGALVFSLICVWINCWVNNREAGDLRRYSAHYDITVMNDEACYNDT